MHRLSTQSCWSTRKAASEDIEDKGRVVDLQQLEGEAAKDEEYRLLHVYRVVGGLSARL